MLVIGTLLVFVVRYRSKGRPREVEGSQVRGHNEARAGVDGRAGDPARDHRRLRLLEGLGHRRHFEPPASERQAKDEITIEGHQYYWEFTYPNGAVSVDHAATAVRPRRSG